MIYNVITSLNRIENLGKLATRLWGQGVHWHVIYDDHFPYKLKSKWNWMKFYECHNIGISFWERCHYALNWFLDYQVLFPDQYYCFLNDDDDYDTTFFDKIRATGSEWDLIITSMSRGHKIPEGVSGERAHGTNTLVAAPENMKPGYVGLEQAIIKGSLLQHARIPMVIDGDGRMIEWLCSNSKPKFMPEAFVLFNYWEPGRWQK